MKLSALEASLMVGGDHAIDTAVAYASRVLVPQILAVKDTSPRVDVYRNNILGHQVEITRSAVRTFQQEFEGTVLDSPLDVSTVQWLDENLSYCFEITPAASFANRIMLLAMTFNLMESLKCQYNTI